MPLSADSGGVRKLLRATLARCCSLSHLVAVLDVLVLLVAVVFQGSTLDFYLIQHNQGSVAWYFWFLADFLVLIGIMSAVFLARRHFRRLAPSPDQPDDATPEPEPPHPILGRFPLCYMSWLLYALLLVAKVVLLFRMDVAQKLQAFVLMANPAGGVVHRRRLRVPVSQGSGCGGGCGLSAAGREPQRGRRQLRAAHLPPLAVHGYHLRGAGQRDLSGAAVPERDTPGVDVPSRECRACAHLRQLRAAYPCPVQIEPVRVRPAATAPGTQTPLQGPSHVPHQHTLPEHPHLPLELLRPRRLSLSHQEPARHLLGAAHSHSRVAPLHLPALKPAPKPHLHCRRPHRAQGHLREGRSARRRRWRAQPFGRERALAALAETVVTFSRAGDIATCVQHASGAGSYWCCVLCL